MELKKLLEEVRVGERTTLDLVEDLNAAGDKTGAKKVVVELRKLHPEEARPPKRSESPARIHEFLSAKSLAAYLAEYGEKTTVVFADPTNEVVSACLDEAAVEGFEVVTMKPALHPLWAPWAALAGRTLLVKEFAAFVAQNRRAVVAPDGRELALTLSQIRGSVSMEIQTGRGKNAINGIVVKTMVKGETQADLVELPDTIRLFVPLYVDTESQAVELDLCIEARTDGEITVVVSSGTVAEARVRSFEDMIGIIREGTDGLGATLTFGRPKHKAWDYLAELKGPQT